MSDSQKSWSDWTKSTKASDLEKVRAELEQIKKWQRTHLGVDFAASGIDYPHPSQKVRTLYFFEGNGRLDPTGIQFRDDPNIAGTYAIYWLPEYSNSPGTYTPSSRISGNIVEVDPGSFRSNIELRAFADATAVNARLEVSAVEASAEPFTSSDTEVRGVVTEPSLTYPSPYFQLFIDSTNDRYFQINNTPLWLNNGTGADFATLSDGMLWYRSDLDRFRARANGTTENLAYESDIPTTMNKQPYAAKSADYTTTVSDGFIAMDSTGGNRVITLVTAVGNAGLRQTFKKIVAANIVTLGPTGGQTIDGAASAAMTAQWASRTLVSDGANWLIESSYL